MRLAGEFILRWRFDASLSPLKSLNGAPPAGSMVGLSGLMAEEHNPEDEISSDEESLEQERWKEQRKANTLLQNQLGGGGGGSNLTSFVPSLSLDTLVSKGPAQALLEKLESKTENESEPKTVEQGRGALVKATPRTEVHFNLES